MSVRSLELRKLGRASWKESYLSRDLKDAVVRQRIYGKVFQVHGSAYAKALRQPPQAK